MITEPDDVMDIDPFDPEVARAAEDQQYEQSTVQADTIKAYVERRRRAYKAVFGREDIKADIAFVMQDLALFSRAFEARFRPDAREHALMDGRAEVFYRIMDYTQLDRDTLYVRIATAKQGGR